MTHRGSSRKGVAISRAVAPDKDVEEDWDVEEEFGFEPSEAFPELPEAIASKIPGFSNFEANSVEVITSVDGLVADAITAAEKANAAMRQVMEIAEAATAADLDDFERSRTTKLEEYLERSVAAITALEEAVVRKSEEKARREAEWAAEAAAEAAAGANLTEDAAEELRRYAQSQVARLAGPGPVAAEAAESVVVPDAEALAAPPAEELAAPEPELKPMHEPVPEPEPEPEPEELIWGDEVEDLAGLLTRNGHRACFTVPEVPRAGEQARVFFRAGSRPLAGAAEVRVRWGFNRWELAQGQAEMEAVGREGWWAAKVNVSKHAYRMDLVFTGDGDDVAMVEGQRGVPIPVRAPGAMVDGNGGAGYRLPVEGGPSQEEWAFDLRPDPERDAWEAEQKAAVQSVLRMHSPPEGDWTACKVFSRPGGEGGAGTVRVYYNRHNDHAPHGDYLFAHVGHHGWEGGVQAVVPFRQPTTQERGEDGLIGSKGLGTPDAEIDWWVADVEVPAGVSVVDFVVSDQGEPGQGGGYDNNRGRDYHVLCVRDGAEGHACESHREGFIGVAVVGEQQVGCTEEAVMRWRREGYRAAQAPARAAFGARTANFIRHAAYTPLPKDDPDVYDPPLDPKFAELQLQAAAEKVLDRDIKCIYTSPARRCVESAARVSELLGGVPVYVEPGLQEWNHDDTNVCKPMADLVFLCPTIDTSYQPMWPSVQEHEARAELVERGRHMGLLLERDGESSLVVSHGSILAFLMEGMTGYMDMGGNHFKCAGVCSLRVATNEFINFNDAPDDGCRI